MRRPILVFGAGGQLGQELMAQASAAPAGRDIAGLTRLEADICDARLSRGSSTRHGRGSSSMPPPIRRLTRPKRTRGGLARQCHRRRLPGARRCRDGSARPSLDRLCLRRRPTGRLSRERSRSPRSVSMGARKPKAKRRCAPPRRAILFCAPPGSMAAMAIIFSRRCCGLRASATHLRVVADQYGCPTATRDLAEAIFAIDRSLAHGDDNAWGTYHFAGTGATSWHGFAAAIVAAQARWTGLRPPVAAIATEDYPTPARRPQFGTR